MTGAIVVRGAREHNLKGIDVTIPTRPSERSIITAGALATLGPGQRSDAA